MRKKLLPFQPQQHCRQTIHFLLMGEKNGIKMFHQFFGPFFIYPCCKRGHFLPSLFLSKHLFVIPFSTTATVLAWLHYPCLSLFPCKCKKVSQWAEIFIFKTTSLLSALGFCSPNKENTTLMQCENLKKCVVCCTVAKLVLAPT